MGSGLDDVWEQLLSGKSLPFEPIPEPNAREIADYWRTAGEAGREDRLSARDWAEHLGMSTSYLLSPRADEPGPVRLLTRDYALTQDALLRRVRDHARTVLNDTGAHLLYLAFGFLEWREPRGRGTTCLAPLLLLPVLLTDARLARGRKAFRLTWNGDEAIWDRPLERKLLLDFRKILPVPEQGAEASAQELPSSYLARVKTLVSDSDGWAVRTFVTLGLFDFAGFPLWNDLDSETWPETEPLHARPLVRQLLGAEPIAVARNGLTGDALGRHIDLDLPLLLPADSSQGAALTHALAGQTMLVEGPPGTGKSQTIANLIAAALGQGRKVLFVSAKRAALDVVHSRLKARAWVISASISTAKAPAPPPCSARSPASARPAACCHQTSRCVRLSP